MFQLLEINIIHMLVTYLKILKLIQLSGRFVYPDDLAGDQSVRINEARLYIHVYMKLTIYQQKLDYTASIGYTFKSTMHADIMIESFHLKHNAPLS
jgi:hypothetical protein